MEDCEAPPADEAVIALLVAREGLETVVRLRDERIYRVHDIAWGYDCGDEYAHVTTNVSPGLEGDQIDFFFTSEVKEIAEGITGELLWPSD